MANSFDHFVDINKMVVSECVVQMSALILFRWISSDFFYIKEF